MNVKREQHLLPRSYLKNWFDPHTVVPNKTPMVWVISKDGLRSELKPVGNSVFWKEYFYDLLSNTGERNQTTEDLLSKIESGISKVITDVLPQKAALDRNEGEAVDLFVACMFMRTQRKKKATDSWTSALDRIEQEHAKSVGQAIPDGATFKHNAHVFALLEGLEIICDSIRTMDHELFMAPMGKFFVTSDDPCVWEAVHGPPGLENRTLQITLPLSPKHLLYISREGRGSAYLDAAPDMVDYLNWRTIKKCEQFFISNQRSSVPSWFENELFWLRRLFEENNCPKASSQNPEN